MNNNQVEILNQLGYFKVPYTSDFVCNLVGCRSRIKCTKATNEYMFVQSSTNTVSVTPISTFGSLISYILDYQYNNAPYEYFERKSVNVDASIGNKTYSYVFAKSNRKSSRDVAKNLVRVKSSNIWSYGVQTELGKNTCDLYVQFKNATGGPGDVYQYFDFPIKTWKKFITAPSKGHFFWKYVRNNYRYRKLTGDKRGKLPNAIN